MRRLLATLLVCFAGIAPAAAQPAVDPLDALVHVAVLIVGPDSSGAIQRIQVNEGSGFLVHKNGWVITSQHLLDVALPSGAHVEIEGSLRSRFAQHFPLSRIGGSLTAADMALLRFPAGLNIVFPYLCVEKYPPIDMGRDVKGLGFPLGGDQSVRPGKITALADADNYVQANMGLAPGMSGGPVLGPANEVIGIITGGIEGQNSFDYFTPVNMGVALFDMPPASFVGTTCVVAPSSIERAYNVDETNDDHDGVTETTKEYVITKRADDGFVIADARFEKESATRESDLLVSVSDDRRSVSLTFKLSSGPVFDRYRGWLHGDLILTLRPVTP